MTDVKLEKYYRSFEEMFRLEGWKNLLEDIKGSADNVNSVEACQDEKDLYFRKGQLYVIGTLLSLEEQVRNAYEDLQNGESNASL